MSTVAFAKVKASTERLRAAHARAAAVSQTVVSPLMVFIVVSAPVLVPFAFGSEWTVSAQIAQPLALAAALSFGTALDHGLFDGVGRPGRWLAFIAAIYGFSVILVTAFAVRYGVVIVAAAFVLTAAVGETITRWVLVGRLLQMPLATSARPFLSVLPATLASIAAGFGAMRLLAGAPTLVVLGVTGVVLLAVHLAVVRFFVPAAWADIRSHVPIR